MDPIVRNNVRVVGRGDGCPMVFLHGYGCDQVMWRYAAPPFESGHKVVLLDYVGMGGSDLKAYDSGRYSTLEGYARDVVEVCEALDLRGAALVGHSVSAMIAMLASFRDPSRISRLVFLCPSPCYWNEPPDYLGGYEKPELEALVGLIVRDYVAWSNALSSAAIPAPDDVRFKRELVGSLCAMDPGIAERFARATFFSDMRDELARVRVPTLVLQCARDPIAPPAVGRYVAEHVPGAELRVLAAEGHCPHLTAAEETVKNIRDFVERRA